MRYLLDTCVISELVARQPDPRVVDWIDSVDPEDVYLSVITVGEITKGIEKLAESNRKTELQNWLNNDLLSRFRDHLIVLDTPVLVKWGQLLARLEMQGRKMPAVDALIAASALLGGLTLVTRNEADFFASGVNILNPWK